MSKIVCPDCGSDNVMTERRLDGYHICRKCCFYWRNEEAPKPTFGDKIRGQSNEGIAAVMCGLLNSRDDSVFEAILNYLNSPAEIEVKDE